MSPRQLGYNESLESYYHYIMDYLHAKYDHHSIEPAYMNEYKIAELNYYEAQARAIVAERQAAEYRNIHIGHVDR